MISNSLKSFKFALGALCLVGIVSTLYVYTDMVNEIGETVTSSRFLEDALDRVLRRKRKPKPVRKRLIWVLGYPYSGRDETITMAEHATESSMATNDGHLNQNTRTDRMWENRYDSELIQKEWYDKGPFKNNAELPVSATDNEILVKISCTGHCMYHDECTRIRYIRDLMSDRCFSMTCKRHRTWVADRERPSRGIRKLISMRRVEKMIINMRNPMEMVTARYKAQGGNKANPDDLDKWCEALDEEYGRMKEFKTLGRTKIIGPVMTPTPCYTEFVRIMTWYDQVFQVFEEKEKIIIFWDSYVEDLDSTAERVLRYAGMEKTSPGDYVMNMYGATDNWFSAEEGAKIKALLMAMSQTRSHRAWPYFARYFKGY